MEKFEIYITDSVIAHESFDSLLKKDPESVISIFEKFDPNEYKLVQTELPESLCILKKLDEESFSDILKKACENKIRFMVYNLCIHGNRYEDVLIIKKNEITSNLNNIHYEISAFNSFSWSISIDLTKNKIEFSPSWECFIDYLYDNYIRFINDKKVLAGIINIETPYKEVEI